jgi:hypothetical protein
MFRSLAVRTAAVALAGIAAVTLAALSSAPRVLPPTPADPNAPPASVATFRAPAGGLLKTHALAVDAQGNAYAAALTSVPNLPGMTSAFQPVLNRQDTVIMKFDPAGRLVWATYLGGNDARSASRLFWGDTPQDIAVDSQGNVYVVGWTGSTDFPTASAVIPQPQAAGAADGYIAKLSPDGSRLIYSTYFGAPDGGSLVRSIVPGPAGEAWVGAVSNARQLATRYDVSGGTGSNIVLELNPSGSVLWSTRLPGNDTAALVVDGAGSPHIAACCDATALSFVARLDASGSRLLYRTSVAPSTASIRDLAFGIDGGLVFAGRTVGGLPTVNAWQPEPAGGIDAFIGLLDQGGQISALSYFGGASDDVLGQLVKVRATATGFAVSVDSESGDLPLARPWVSGHVDGPVYTSNDRGASWWRAEQGTLNVAVNDLAIEAPGNVLHAATGLGLYLSFDNGVTWTQERRGRHTIVTQDWRGPRYISDGFLVSRHDRGWERGVPLLTALPGATLKVVAVNPADASIWVSGNYGVDSSFDGGRTWISRREGLPTSQNLTGRPLSPDAIAFDATGEAVYLGLDVGLYVGGNRGVGWRNLTEDIAASLGGPIDVNCVLVAGDALLAGTSGRGLLISHDRGMTWSVVLAGRTVVALAKDYIDDTRIYASVDDAEGQAFIWQSVDLGRTWQPSSSAWQFRRAPKELLVHPFDTVRLYAISWYYTYVPYLAHFAQGTAAAGVGGKGTVARPIAAGPSTWRAGDGGSAPRIDLASYLATGQVRDLAVSPTGDLVVLVEISDGFSAQPAEFAIVRMGR